MDYTPKHTFTAATPTSALEVAENMFEPHTTPTSPSVFNGWLEAANRDSAWDVTWELVRKGSFVRTGHSNGSSGATANIDFFDNWFAGDAWDLNTVNGALARAMPIPGASRSFNVPWATASAIWLNFTVTLICDRAGYVHPGGLPPSPINPQGPSPGGLRGNTILIPCVNDVALKFWTRRVISSKLTLPERPTPNDSIHTDYLQPEQRTYAIHCLLDPAVAVAVGLVTNDNNPLLRGDHTAELRIAHRETHVRVKTCHVTAFPIR